MAEQHLIESAPVGVLEQVNDLWFLINAATQVAGQIDAEEKSAETVSGLAFAVVELLGQATRKLSRLESNPLLRSLG